MHFGSSAPFCLKLLLLALTALVIAGNAEQPASFVRAASTLTMKSFFSISAASASSGRAEQPAGYTSEEHDVGGSAAQPALQLRSIVDVQRWLATEHCSASSAEVQRVREAAKILASPKPRQEDIRDLQSPSNWNVAGKRAGKPRPLADVIEDLKCKVLEAARKLQRQLTESRASASGNAAKSLKRMSQERDTDVRQVFLYMYVCISLSLSTYFLLSMHSGSLAA